MPSLPTEQPLVSVIIPVYNAGKYLRETLDCVCGQTLREIEIICVDDGSTDDSLNILQEYAAKDGRMRILQQKNQYAGVARNHGMAVARGKYLAFFDSDDIFMPDMLMLLVERAESVAADLVCCNGMGYDEASGQLYEMPWILPGIRTLGVDTACFCPVQDVPGEVFKYSGSVPWNKLYRRKFVEEAGCVWLSTQSSNDLTFVCHCMAVAEQVSLMDEVLLHYRVRPDSIWHSCSKSPRNMYEAHVELLQRMRVLGMPAEVLEGVYEHLLDEMLWHLGEGAHGTGRERADVYIREFEPVFHVLKRDMGRLNRHPAYMHLKAYAAPAAAVVVKIVEVTVGMEECLRSLDGAGVEIVLDTGMANPEAARQAGELADRIFWVHVSSTGRSLKAPVVAKMESGRFLLPWVDLGKLLARHAGSGVLDLHRYSRRYSASGAFYVRTPHRCSWRLWRIPLLTLVYRERNVSCFVVGFHVADFQYRQ